MKLTEKDLEEIEKATMDMVVYGSGTIVVRQDGLWHVPIKDFKVDIQAVIKAFSENPKFNGLDPELVKVAIYDDCVWIAHPEIPPHIFENGVFTPQNVVFNEPDPLKDER